MKRIVPLVGYLVASDIVFTTMFWGDKYPREPWLKVWKNSNLFISLLKSYSRV
jgi:hypothetical protein